MTSVQPIRPLTAPLEIRDAGPGRGRGVFATGPILKGSLLETVPVLVLSRESYESHGKHTELCQYTFCWPGGCQALALGMTGSMWNHQKKPNVGFIRNITEQTITFSALEFIEPGRECCINYGRHIWFDDGAESSDSDCEGAAEFLAGFSVSDNAEAVDLPPGANIDVSDCSIVYLPAGVSS